MPVRVAGLYAEQTGIPGPRMVPQPPDPLTLRRRQFYEPWLRQRVALDLKKQPDFADELEMVETLGKQYRDRGLDISPDELLRTVREQMAKMPQAKGWRARRGWERAGVRVKTRMRAAARSAAGQAVAGGNVAEVNRLLGREDVEVSPDTSEWTMGGRKVSNEYVTNLATRAAEAESGQQLRAMRTEDVLFPRRGLPPGRVKPPTPKFTEGPVKGTVTAHHLIDPATGAPRVLTLDIDPEAMRQAEVLAGIGEKPPAWPRITMPDGSIVQAPTDPETGKLDTSKIETIAGPPKQPLRSSLDVREEPYQDPNTGKWGTRRVYKVYYPPTAAGDKARLEPLEEVVLGAPPEEGPWSQIVEGGRKGYVQVGTGLKWFLPEGVTPVKWDDKKTTWTPGTYWVPVLDEEGKQKRDKKTNKLLADPINVYYDKENSRMMVDPRIDAQVAEALQGQMPGLIQFGEPEVPGEAAAPEEGLTLTGEGATPAEEPPKPPVEHTRAGTPIAAPGQALPNGLRAATREEIDEAIAVQGEDPKLIEAYLKGKGATALYEEAPAEKRVRRPHGMYDTSKMMETRVR